MFKVGVEAKGRTLIDIHCHILPALDDGPADLEVSLAMARMAVADGIHKLVATPHIGENAQPADIIRERVSLFNDALHEFGINLVVLFGGENVFNLGTETLSRYCINDSRYLLLEFPHSHLPTQADEVIFDLLAHDLVPIITHPERNPSIVRQPQLLLDLVERGALVQLTAESLTGGFGPASQACARYLLKQGAVHFLASDGHSADWRPPILSAGLKVATKLIGQEAAMKLVKDNPAKVIRGEDL